MKRSAPFVQLATCALALVFVLTTTGCFRVSSETRALRDAALENGFASANQKIEVGVGFFTVGLARIVSRYVDMPSEARTALGALKQAECSVYEVLGERENFASVLADADTAMEHRGCERLVGVVDRDQLVAVYVPRDMNSARDLKASVLVLNRKQLVCVTARANARDLMQLAMQKLPQYGDNGSVAPGKQMDSAEAKIAVDRVVTDVLTTRAARDRFPSSAF